MGLKEALFTFDGRMKRLEYFLYSLLIFFILFVGLALGIAISAIGAESTGGSVAVIIGVLIALAAFGVSTVGAFAIGIKRLHDIGYVGTHMIWIWLLSIAGGVLHSVSPVLGIICTFASFGVGLWLLFTSSVEDNKWGQKR